MRKFLFALAALPAVLPAFAQAQAPFVCGGVAQDGQQAMEARAPGHDVMLTFAAAGGAYLADVDVQIRDARGGIVLQARCDGPMMLVDLPRAGNYEIAATSGGHTLRRSAQLGGSGKPQRLTFHWPKG